MALIVARHSSPQDWFPTRILLPIRRKRQGARGRCVVMHPTFLLWGPHAHTTPAIRSRCTLRVPPGGVENPGVRRPGARGTRARPSAAGVHAATGRPRTGGARAQAEEPAPELAVRASADAPSGRFDLSAGQAQAGKQARWPRCWPSRCITACTKEAHASPQRVLFPASLPLAWLGLRCGQQSTAMARA